MLHPVQAVLGIQQQPQPCTVTTHATPLYHLNSESLSLTEFTLSLQHWTIPRCSLSTPTICDPCLKESSFQCLNRRVGLQRSHRGLSCLNNCPSIYVSRADADIQIHGDLWTGRNCSQSSRLPPCRGRICQIQAMTKDILRPKFSNHYLTCTGTFAYIA